MIIKYVDSSVLKILAFIVFELIELDNSLVIEAVNPPSKKIIKPAIAIVKLIMENAAKFGYVYEGQDLYQAIPVRKHGLDTAITNLAEFSKEMDINYKILKIHNPWLREGFLNNKSRKLYTLEIPEKGYYENKN